MAMKSIRRVCILNGIFDRCTVGLVDEEKDTAMDLSQIRAEPLVTTTL